MNEEYRIKFHSVNDLSAGLYVEKIENYILPNKKNISINDFFEVYNIKLYFDNDFYPKTWSDATKVKNKKNIQDTYNQWKEDIFIKQINDDNLQYIFDELDYRYQDDFWKLFNDYSVYKNINKEVFQNFLENQSRQINTVIYYENIVKHFSIVIKIFLMQYEKAAEIIIDYEEEKNIFLPKSLTNEDKNEIIKQYLSHNYPQIFNYTRFIQNFKNSSSFNLNDKTRLLAKRKFEELSESLFKKNSGIGISHIVQIDKDQKKPIVEKYNNLECKMSIGGKYLENLKEDIDLFQLFEMVFLSKGLIGLIAKKNDEGVYASMLSKSKTEYAPNNFVFRSSETQALLSIKSISTYLLDKGETIERYMDSFVKYLNQHIEPNELRFNPPSKETSYLEKTRHLIAEFEALLKQYDLLTDEGEIDYDLVHISTKPTAFGEMKSGKNKKYMYESSNELANTKNIFFSKQNMLALKNKSNNLYELFIKEKITLSDFTEYERPHIEQLIKDDYLRCDTLGNIQIHKPYMMNVLHDLYHYNVINYSHSNVDVKNEIDTLIQNKQLQLENKLFTKDEVSYLNFYMNEKKFTDGYKLHNRYAHGANTSSPNEHEQDYLRILNVLILVLLKIEDDILDV